MCGLGFDAVVNRKVAADRDHGRTGPMKYHYHVLSSLFGYVPTRVTLTVDGEQSCREVLSLAVGIGCYNGGGMKQLPGAVPDDGLLDVTVIRALSPWKALRSVKQLYDGSFIALPEVDTYTGKLITVRSEPACDVEADGEPLGQTPCRFDLLPRSLRVVVPA